MTRSLLRTALFAVVVCLFPAAPTGADEIRPALLDIREQNTGLFAVTWKVPTRGNRALGITPKLPANFELALLLIVNGLVPLSKAVTAFTVAHSITLALATPAGACAWPRMPSAAWRRSGRYSA